MRKDDHTFRNLPAQLCVVSIWARIPPLLRKRRRRMKLIENIATMKTSLPGPWNEARLVPLNQIARTM